MTLAIFSLFSQFTIKVIFVRQLRVISKETVEAKRTTRRIERLLKRERDEEIRNIRYEAWKRASDEWHELRNQDAEVTISGGGTVGENSRIGNVRIHVPIILR
jgi:hypothetical protein